MRRASWVVILLLTTTSLALAQDEPKPDQMKKMYDDALGQLKQAQDRKNELAAENEKLNAKLADLQKQLDALKIKQSESDRQAAGFAERTYFLRTQYAAWQEFLAHYPKLDEAWKIFLTGDDLSPRELPLYIDTGWPTTAPAK